jgi:hypothetical protein
MVRDAITTGESVTSAGTGYLSSRTDSDSEDNDYTLVTDAGITSHSWNGAGPAQYKAPRQSELVFSTPQS